MYFLEQLKFRNETLFYYGLACLFFAIACLLLTKLTTTQVYGVNAWFKPFKFAFSTFLYAWAMAWYCHYLPKFNIEVFNWSIIILLGFEIIYISWQASKGQESHFNLSTPIYATLFSMMAIAASLVTLYTAYIAMLFFSGKFPELPDYYLWAIRLSLIIFVIFSFQGFLMGSRLSHTVGLVNDNSDLYIAGWSKLAGDLRIAHFIGMHALQVLPVVAYYVLKDLKLTVMISILYGLLAVFTLVQALQGKSLFR
ncbi:MAG TPA: hypothetical protein PKD18_20825 [Saprospiraceae bacterium]|nr:hypothetical protein [Saprospiraceae bacterium]